MDGTATVKGGMNGIPDKRGTLDHAGSGNAVGTVVAEDAVGNGHRNGRVRLDSRTGIALEDTVADFTGRTLRTIDPKQRVRTVITEC